MADVDGATARPFTLAGEVRRPVTLTVTDLRGGWEQHRAEVTFDCASDGPQHHTFEGPLLREVVADAGPAFDVHRRKDRARFLLAVTGGDGHHAVLSWAEIDADFGGAPVLLATTMDGRPLDPEGSQLVVPWDRCGARYISAITRVWVGHASFPCGEMPAAMPSASSPEPTWAASSPPPFTPSSVPPPVSQPSAVRPSAGQPSVSQPSAVWPSAGQPSAVRPSGVRPSAGLAVLRPIPDGVEGVAP